MEIFGSGGGAKVSESLTRIVGAEVPLLGQIPLDPSVVTAGDEGTPIVLSHPDSAVAKAIQSIASKLTVRQRGLVGMSLNIDTTRRQNLV